MAKKILIVEDERDVVKLLRYNLEKEGFRVSSVADGSLALAEMRREVADLVILDLMLPGMSGLAFRKKQVLRKITVRRQFTPNSSRSAFCQNVSIL